MRKKNSPSNWPPVALPQTSAVCFVVFLLMWPGLWESERVGLRAHRGITLKLQVLFTSHTDTNPCTS